jgi:hypothetical protein
MRLNKIYSESIIKFIFRTFLTIFIYNITPVSNSFSQTVIFEEQVDTNPDFGRVGPNKKNFLHFFIGFGCIAGPSENAGSNIKYLLSTDFELGYRYKRKITNFYSLGTELFYHGSSFVLKQDSLKTLPNSNLNKNETFRFYGASLGIYNRINFGKRGNILGNYLDLGGSFDLPISILHDVKNDGPNETVIRTLTSHLDYVKKYYYYGFLRLGSNRFCIKTSYRFSNLFRKTNDYNFAELPRLIASLQIGIHK